MIKNIIYFILFILVILAFAQVVLLLQSRVLYEESTIFIASLIAIILSIVLIVALGLILETSIFAAYKSLLKNTRNIGEKKLGELKEKGFYKEIYRIAQKAEVNTSNLRQFVENITKLNFDTSISPETKRHILAEALIEMRDKLKVLNEEEEKRRWTMKGLTKFADILRNAHNKNLERWTYAIIKNMSQYLNAQQGAIFLVKSEEGKEDYFEISAVYAYQKEDLEQNKIPINEGYLGQAYKVKRIIQFDNIPESYTKSISSSLGKAKPKSLTLIPFVENEQVLGVIELASLQPLEAYQISFLRNIAENLAISMDSFLLDMQQQELLEQTALANSKLQKREQQMQTNSQALEKTQRILSEKIKTIQEETNLIRHILTAIDKTNALMEFDVEGSIIEANQMYLSVMGYEKEELLGEKETLLIPKNTGGIERYEMIWNTLREGKSISGEYIRISKLGRKVWLNGTYNPILNLKGEPSKVIMLAQFTTEEKERELEQNSKIKALGQALTMIDLDIEAKVIKVNEHFLQEIGYKRTEMRRRAISVIIHREDTAKFAEAFKEALAKQKGKILYLKFQDVRHNIIQTLAYINPVKKLTGNIDKILLTLVNITELENTKQKLLSKQKELTNTIQTLKITQNNLKQQNQEFELLNDMFQKASMTFELDENYNFININNNLKKRLDIDSQDQAPKNFDDIIFPKFNKESLEDFYQSLSKGQKAKATIKYLSLKEEKFWGNTTITPFENHNEHRKYYLGIIIDVSEDAVQSIYLRGEIVALKMTNAMIKYKEVSGNEDFSKDNILDKVKNMSIEQVEDLMQHSNITPYLKINEEAKIVDFNRLSLDLLGFQERELKNKSLKQIISAHGKVDKSEIITQFLDKTKRHDDIIILNDKNRSGLYARVLTIPKHNLTYFFFKIL